MLKCFNSLFKSLRILLLLPCLLFFFNTNCSQSTEPNEDVLISFLQIDPEFSPDDKLIVFKGLYDSIYAVHFVDINGNYKGYILNNFGFLSSPSWSPEGNIIAVSIEGNLYTVKINGDSLTIITNTGEDFFCNWSPDGKYIAYTNSICDPECGIMLNNLSGGSTSLFSQYGSYASWSSDSKRVYFYNNFYVKRPDSHISDYKGFVFKRKDVSTLKEDSLFYVKSNDTDLWLVDCTVSPNEEEILFAASYGSPPQMNIWKLNLQTGTRAQMTFDGGHSPAYSSDGAKIVYANTNINEGGLWIMNKDGSNKQRLTKLKR